MADQRQMQRQHARATGGQAPGRTAVSAGQDSECAAGAARRHPPRSSMAAELTAAAASAGEDIDRCLALAREWGPAVPHPGRGDTGARWELLAAAAAGDLTAARVLEPHLDALATLNEAGHAALPGVWGVFAAEVPGTALTATCRDGDWIMEGIKPWCSLGGRLDRALVTAHTDRGRRLFAVDLHHTGVQAKPGTWVSRGLRAVDSGPIEFHTVPAEPVGEPVWYLSRPGFCWGGIGVAACWFGAATALVDGLAAALARRNPDPVRATNLGAADAARYAARSSLAAAAAEVDSGSATGAAGVLLALRARSIVHDACEAILREVGHALGPAPLAFDEIHARRVADLEIYLRQHHGERDLAELGAQLLTGLAHR